MRLRSRLGRPGPHISPNGTLVLSRRGFGLCCHLPWNFPTPRTQTLVRRLCHSDDNERSLPCHRCERKQVFIRSRPQFSCSLSSCAVERPSSCPRAKRTWLGSYGLGSVFQAKLTRNRRITVQVAFGPALPATLFLATGSPSTTPVPGYSSNKAAGPNEHLFRRGKTWDWKNAQ
eukprot:2116355-Rhodomonas_salina.2